MKSLVMHPLTEQQVTSFAESPSHSLLLVGPTGSGKLTLATRLAEVILELPEQKFSDYPYKLIINKGDSASIGIEAVRELENFLSLKVPRQTAHNRAIIIENAQTLSLEAQNALLKTLEEPPAGAFVILTVDNEQALLPTIRSRARTINVKRPEQSLVETHFESRNFDNQTVQQAYAVSSGLPGLMQAMLEETDHPLLLATQKARQLLSQTAYERLQMVDELAKQRVLAQDTIFILQQMAHVSLQTAQGDKAARWQAVMKASYQAAEALAANAQPKLVLTTLMLNF